MGEAYVVGEGCLDYHPLLLFHYLCKGQNSRARAAIRHLATVLRSTSASVPRIRLTTLLEGEVNGRSTPGLSSAEASNPFSLVHISADVDVGPTGISEVDRKEGGQEPLTKAEAREVSEKILEAGAPGLDGAEGLEVVAALDCLLEMDGGGGGSCQLTLDAPARRYLLRWLLVPAVPVPTPVMCHLAGSEWLSDPPACDWCARRRGWPPGQGRWI